MLLNGYLALEQAVLFFEDSHTKTVDDIRDIMDGMFHELTDEERAYLNGRSDVETKLIR